MDSLAVNGIESKWVEVTPAAGAWMLVNNWTFRGPPSFPGDSVWPYKFLLGSEFTGGIGMVTDSPAGPLYGDLESESGLPGQNSPTPSEKAFNLHFIVKVEGIPGIGGPYFDPSYGATYDDDCDFENQAIAGYADPIFGQPATTLKARMQFGACSVNLSP
jgi:hypothetical protein